MVKVNRFLWIRAKFYIRLQIYKNAVGPWAAQRRHGAAGVGGRVARDQVPLQPRHQPAPAHGARHACFRGRTLSFLPSTLSFLPATLSFLPATLSFLPATLSFLSESLPAAIASTMLTIVLIDNERGGRGEGREVPISCTSDSLSAGEWKVGRCSFETLI